MPGKEMDLNGAALQLGPIKDLKLKQHVYMNEYIMYDVDQIQIKYLFRCKFS